MCWPSSREPAAVTVSSIADSSEPRRSPDSVRVNSRLARVAWSIDIVVPAASREGQAAVAALRLLSAPVSVHVRLGRSGLAAFKHDNHWHDVAEWCGPERLAPRWWRHDAAGSAGETPGSRNYYTARTADGTLWLLYRGDTEGQWFLEGWLD